MTVVKPGDVAARVDGGRVELVRVARCNSRRVLSYLVPGRTKPIAATGDAEFASVAQYPKAAARLYEKGEREFEDVAAARRAIMDEADTDAIMESI